MCSVCGCSHDDVRIDGKVHSHTRGEHDHGKHAPGTHGHGAHGHADGHDEAGTPQGCLIEVEQNILARNDSHAEVNARLFAETGVLAINLMSSPGAGKTTLLAATARALHGEREVAVVEGDQETSNDTERIRAAGARALQINTGRGCHLDAHMVHHAVETLAPAPGSLLFIENVGNLVCPASFRLGEAYRVVVLSVTEGDDKPDKYPEMFAACDLMILNKIDLLPYVDFDVERSIAHARRANPALEVIQVSATKGEGMDGWLHWLTSRQVRDAGGLGSVRQRRKGRRGRRNGRVSVRYSTGYGG